MHMYAVGQPYSPTRSLWEPSVDYNWTQQGGHELRLFIKNISKDEFRSIKTGRAEFGLMVVRPVIFFLYRFVPGLRWSDVPYDFHQTLRGYDTPPPEPLDPARPLQRDLLNVILVESTTGIIQVLKATTFSPEFSGALRTAIRDQAASEAPSDRAFRAVMQQVYATFPTGESLAAAASVRCIGGAE